MAITVGGDVLLYRGRIGATGGPPADANWLQRLDLNADNYITVGGDMLMYTGRIGETCTQAGVSVSGDNCEWCSFPLHLKTVHQHRTHHWCWWFFGWHCQDKYWLYLDQDFYWCGFPVVLAGPYHVDTGATPPYYVGDIWYEVDQSRPDMVRTLAGVNVILMPEIYIVGYPVEVWIDFYAGGTYSVGDNGWFGN